MTKGKEGSGVIFFMYGFFRKDRLRMEAAEIWENPKPVCRGGFKVSSGGLPLAIQAIFRS